MNRFALVIALGLVFVTVSVAEAQYYTTYYAPTTAYYQPSTVYYAPAPVTTTYYAAPVVARPVAYTTYYAPAPTYYVARPPVVYYRAAPRIFPRYRWW